MFQRILSGVNTCLVIHSLVQFEKRRQKNLRVSFPPKCLSLPLKASGSFYSFIRRARERGKDATTNKKYSHKNVLRFPSSPWEPCSLLPPSTKEEGPDEADDINWYSNMKWEKKRKTPTHTQFKDEQVDGRILRRRVQRTSSLYLWAKKSSR